MIKGKKLRNTLGLIGLVGGGLLALNNAVMDAYVTGVSDFIPALCNQAESTFFYAIGAFYSIGAFGDMAIWLTNLYNKSDSKNKLKLENEVDTMVNEKKTPRDLYCDGPNPLGVRRSDGHINAFTYMAEDGTIIHETP